MTLFIPEKAVSHRQKRVCTVIKNYLSTLILRGDLPPAFTKEGEHLTLPSPITITQVKVSADLGHAFVSVMPLGGLHLEETLIYLEAISKYLRHQVAKDINLRATPQFHFEIDQAYEAGQRIDELLKKL